MATQVPNRRLRRDTALTTSKALPAAGANNTSTGVYIGVGPFHSEEINVELAIPACPNLTSTSDSLTVQLYDSADGVTYAATVPNIAIVIPGIASTGTAALVKTIKLPIGTRAYIAFNQSVTSGGGDNTAVSPTYSILL